MAVPLSRHAMPKPYTPSRVEPSTGVDHLSQYWRSLRCPRQGGHPLWLADGQRPVYSGGRARGLQTKGHRQHAIHLRRMEEGTADAT